MEETKYGPHKAGAGWRCLAHFAQIMRDEAFQRYSYGEEENQKVYGQSTAPKYQLKNIKSPIALFSGSKDNIVTPKDVDWLKTQISDVLVFDKQLPFEHSDYMKKPSFLGDVIEILQKYSQYQ